MVTPDPMKGKTSINISPPSQFKQFVLDATSRRHYSELNLSNYLWQTIPSGRKFPPHTRSPPSTEKEEITPSFNPALAQSCAHVSPISSVSFSHYLLRRGRHRAPIVVSAVLAARQVSRTLRTSGQRVRRRGRHDRTPQAPRTSQFECRRRHPRRGVIQHHLGHAAVHTPSSCAPARHPPRPRLAAGSPPVGSRIPIKDDDENLCQAARPRPVVVRPRPSLPRRCVPSPVIRPQLIQRVWAQANWNRAVILRWCSRCKSSNLKKKSQMFSSSCDYKVIFAL